MPTLQSSLAEALEQRLGKVPDICPSRSIIGSIIPDPECQATRIQHGECRHKEHVAGFSEIDKGLEGEPTIRLPLRKVATLPCVSLYPPAQKQPAESLQGKSGICGCGTVGDGEITGHGGDGAGGRQFW